MRTTKYYYSKPAYVRYLRTFLNGQGDVLYIDDKADVKNVRLPRITVASVHDKDTNMMYFGVAVCNVKDVFKKAIGRKLAYDRAINSPELVVDLTDFSNRIREASTTNANRLIDEYIHKYV